MIFVMRIVLSTKKMVDVAFPPNVSAKSIILGGWKSRLDRPQGVWNQSRCSLRGLLITNLSNDIKDKIEHTGDT